jgi:hypothetical protein
VSNRTLRTCLIGSLAAAALLAGCGADESADPPNAASTGFARALATLGGGGSGEPGFGWVDVAALRAEGRPAYELTWAAGALGPGGDDIARGEGTERAGLDPGEAEQLIAVVGSYTIGARFDGVGEQRIEAALRDLARPQRSGPWTLFDVSQTATTPLGSPLEGLSSYPSRSAVMPGSVVLARFLVARTALIGSGDSPLASPLVAAATGCLGDVVAARIVPNNFTYLGSEAPQLFAFGVTPDRDGRREVLCVLDEDEAAVSAAAEGMRNAFAPDASDVVTDEPMTELIEAAGVEELELEGIAAARATLTPARGAEPGLLFRAFPRGSTLTYVGLREPYPEDLSSEPPG